MSKPTVPSVKWFVIANPEAGGGAVRRQWPHLAGLLDRFLPSYELVFTDRALHATVLAEQAVQQGFRFVLGIGGDGTNHEIVNGLLRQQVLPAAEITYALLPVGTGNDWRRTYGIPREPEKWLREIISGKTVLQDIGKVTYQWAGKTQERFFVNEAGMAYSGFIIYQAAQNNGGFHNRLGYLWAVVRCLFKYHLQKARITLAGGQVLEKKCYTINAGIGRFCGGGMRLSPHADPADGRLALTIAGPVSKAGVILNTYRFFNGNLGRHPQVSLHQVESLRVESLDAAPILLEADGEFLGHTPVFFELLPHALRVVVPAGYAKG